MKAIASETVPWFPLTASFFTALDCGDSLQAFTRAILEQRAAGFDLHSWNAATQGNQVVIIALWKPVLIQRSIGAKMPKHQRPKKKGRTS